MHMHLHEAELHTHADHLMQRLKHADATANSIRMQLFTVCTMSCTCTCAKHTDAFMHGMQMKLNAPVQGFQMQLGKACRCYCKQHADALCKACRWTCTRHADGIVHSKHLQLRMPCDCTRARHAGTTAHRNCTRHAEALAQGTQMHLRTTCPCNCACCGDVHG